MAQFKYNGKTYERPEYFNYKEIVYLEHVFKVSMDEAGAGTRMSMEILAGLQREDSIKAWPFERFSLLQHGKDIEIIPEPGEEEDGETQPGDEEVDPTGESVPELPPRLADSPGQNG